MAESGLRLQAIKGKCAGSFA